MNQDENRQLMDLAKQVRELERENARLTVDHARLCESLAHASARFAELWHAYCVVASNGGCGMQRHLVPVVKECRKWQREAEAALNSQPGSGNE